MREDPMRHWSVSGRNLDKLRRRVRAYALMLSRRKGIARKDIAEEITQQTFEKYFSKPSLIDASKDPFPLLCTIAYGVWVDYCRKQAREIPHGTVPLDERTQSHQSLTPQQQALDSEIHHEFDQALDKLTPINRKIAFCRAYLELSWPQIGTIVGLSESAVESRWRYTIKPHLQRHLRKCISALLALPGAIAGWLQGLRDNVISTAAAAGAAAVLIQIPIPHSPEPVPAPIPPEQNIITIDPHTRVPTTVERPLPHPNAPIQRSTSSGTGTARTYRETLSARTSITDGRESQPTVRTEHSLELSPDPFSPGRQEADSNEVHTPYGTIISGGDAHTTGPIGQPPCVAGLETCSETSHPEQGSG